jgi:hypothetical protein
MSLSDQERILCLDYYEDLVSCYSIYTVFTPRF